MAEFTVYTADGPGTAAEDVAVTLGIKFSVSAPSWLLGYRFWRAPDGVADPADTASLWLSAIPGEGTPVAGSSVAFTDPGTPGEWQEARLADAVALTPGNQYTAGVHIGGGFSVTPAFWSTGPGDGGITNGPLTAPDVDVAVGGEQNSFTYGAAITYPATAAPGGGSYHVDVIVSDVDPGSTVEVTLDFTVQQTLAGSGAKTSSATASMTVPPPVGLGPSPKIAASASGFTVASTLSATAAAAVGDQAALICSPWATLDDLPDSKPALTAAEWTRLLLIASQTLWAFSGRQWSGGGCTATATFRDHRPCWEPYRGLWPEGWASARIPSQSPDGMAVLKLPHDEVTGIDSVTVDGVAFTTYYRRGSMLVRDDGRHWSGLVLVTYSWGLAPPPGGASAAAALALELGKALIGDSTCRLPKRVTQVTRQNVSMTLLDPANYMTNGLTGLADVDQWLVSVNPKRRPERGGLWSPDIANAWPL